MDQFRLHQTKKNELLHLDHLLHALGDVVACSLLGMVLGITLARDEDVCTSRFTGELLASSHLSVVRVDADVVKVLQGFLMSLGLSVEQPPIDRLLTKYPPLYSYFWICQHPRNIPIAWKRFWYSKSAIN